MSVDWTNSKYFKANEFTCSHTGTEKMDQGFINKLNNLREIYGKPMTVSSGYRDSTHPVEAVKKDPTAGAHVSGKAADIFDEYYDKYKKSYKMFHKNMHYVDYKKHKEAARVLSKAAVVVDTIDKMEQERRK